MRSYRLDNSDLEAAEHGLVLRADVRAAAEGGDRHRVAVQDRKVVAVAPVWSNELLMSISDYALNVKFTPITAPVYFGTHLVLSFTI